MSDGLTDADIPKRIGHIRHVPVGQWFKNREELSKAHVHPPWEDGIYVGDEKPGEKGPAKSVVLANRPEYPNEDYGERFTYIGMGGRDGEDGDELNGNENDTTEKKKKKKTHGGPQTSDQDFTHSANAALEEAVRLGSYVRVTRGAGASKYAPTEGYRYDGLYYVENPRREIGPTGQFLVCKFDFVRVDSAGLNGTLPTDNGIDAEP